MDMLQDQLLTIVTRTTVTIVTIIHLDPTLAPWNSTIRNGEGFIKKIKLKFKDTVMIRLSAQVISSMFNKRPALIKRPPY